MLAGTRESAKNVSFLQWIDGHHLIVDFCATIEIGRHHYATQQAGKAALVDASYHLIPSLDTASGVSKTAIWRKKGLCAAHLVKGLILERTNLHHGSSQGFGFLCR